MVKICLNCQQSNREQARFCEKCGQAFPLEESDVRSEKLSDEGKEPERYCGNCGQKAAKGDRFCLNCGQGLTEPLKDKTDEETKEASEELTGSTDPVEGESSGANYSSVREAQEGEPTPALTEFCPECGQANATGDRFCANCGADLSAEGASEAALTRNHHPQGPQPLTKKDKLKRSLLGLVAVALVGGYFYGKQVYTPDRQIQQLVEAIQKGDAKTLAQHVASEDPAVEVSPESVKPLLLMMKYDKGSVKKLKKMTSRDFDKGLEPGGYPAEIKPEGKIWGLYPKYVLRFKPYTLHLEARRKGTEMYIGKKKVATAISDNYEKKISPCLPGVYEVKGRLKWRGKTIKMKEYAVPDKYTASFDPEFMTIPVQTDVEKADVYIDGKKVGSFVGGRGEVGPLLFHEGMTIQLRTKLKEGKMKTNLYEISSGEFGETTDGTDPLQLNFSSVDDGVVQNFLSNYYNKIAEVTQHQNTYNPAEFADTFFEGGQSNKAFKAINEYINWCRDRSAKKTFDSVVFDVEADQMEAVEKGVFSLDYQVVYNTSYPFGLNKPLRQEGFYYTGVKVKAQNNKKGETILKFMDNGDGGKKNADNHPELG